MRKAFASLVLLAAGAGAAVLIASPGAGARSLVDGTLNGHVGMANNANAFSIGLSATTVAPGTYELDINDYADIHNFHFCNQGANAWTCAANAPVNVATTIDGQGLTTFDVALTPGKYSFHCDAHSSLHGTLVVTGGGTTTGTTSTTTTTPALAGQITSVSSTRKVVTVSANANQPAHFKGTLLKGSTQLATTTVSGTTVKFQLKPAKALKPGNYVVQVRIYTTASTFKIVKKPIHVS